MIRHIKYLPTILVIFFLILPFGIWAAETWNEATPASTESPTLGDDRIREFKTAIRERLAADHMFEASEGTPFGDSGSTIGFHKKVTLIEQSSDPTTNANEIAIYTKDDGGGNTEIYIRGPSSGTVYRFTTSNSTLIEQDVVELLKDLTATYTEINTVADGATAKNSHTHNLADGAADVTATYSEVNNAADGIGVSIPRQTIVEIGDWNMDTTPSVTVAHGLTLSKIIGCRVAIRNDGDGGHYFLTPNYEATNDRDGAIRLADSTNVTLDRLTGGIYDNANFDSTSYNRGWIILDYID